MLAQLVSVALTASVKATDTKTVSSFNHFLSGTTNENVIESLYDNVIKTYSTCSDAHTFGQKIVLTKESAGIIL